MDISNRSTVASVYARTAEQTKTAIPLIQPGLVFAGNVSTAAPSAQPANALAATATVTGGGGAFMPRMRGFSRGKKMMRKKGGSSTSADDKETTEVFVGGEPQVVFVKDINPDMTLEPHDPMDESTEAHLDQAVGDLF